jgi:hypothetical protein
MEGRLIGGMGGKDRWTNKMDGSQNGGADIVDG